MAKKYQHWEIVFRTIEKDEWTWRNLPFHLKFEDKETAKMRSELQVGDEIVTIGGIIGIIVSMKEDSLVIETGSDRSKVRLTRWAISGKNTTAEPK